MSEVEERRAVGGLPAHVAGAFDEIAACHILPSGEYVVFDRRAHAVYTFARGAQEPKRIVQIGSERGRIIRPTAFDSAADSSVWRMRPAIDSASSSSFPQAPNSAVHPARQKLPPSLGDLVSGLGALSTGKRSSSVSRKSGLSSRNTC
jgi:hypothetical protein